MSERLGNYFIGDGQVLDTGFFSRYQQLTEDHPAVYEVIRVEEGIPLFLEDYLARLKNSFALMGKAVPVSEEQVKASLFSLIRVNRHVSGPVKLVFGAGEKLFYYAFLMKAHLPGPGEYISGVKTVLMKEVRENPGLKIWNRGLRDRSVALLENSGAYEAILVNEEGVITEASRSNVFFIRGDEVYTTVGELVLPGITRKKVMEVCRQQGIPVNLVTIPVSEIGHYDSCFLTGTARKIVPVRSIGEIAFEVDTELLREVSAYFEAFVLDYIRKQF